MVKCISLNQFISNDYKNGKKVLCTIIDELSKCDEFIISVAFITMGGIEPLLQILKDLENKGVKGKILTTDYLTFSDPKALSKLHEFKNIELRMYVSNNDKDGFHTKGYIFKKMENYNIIVGSSNITQNALTVNKEWNTKVSSFHDEEYTKDILNEFYDFWDAENTLNYNEFIYNYELKYEIVKQQKLVIKDNKTPDLQSYKLEPNSMQVKFISNLRQIVEKGESRALLVSSTGTGKTYASAFALRDQKPNKILFLVHREQIARKAMESYKKVFGDNVSMGVLSGSSSELYSKFLFSTMQMMAKDEIQKKFNKEEFDIIVVDEAHTAGNPSYKKIMEYFTPKLYLGMTASPYRMDGFDIFGLFHHNIACEIKLQDALIDNLLCPFHYFGIIEFLAKDGNEEIVDPKDFRNFNKLVDDKRIDYILDKIKFYGYSGDRVKGLVFVSTKNEARELSKMFNERGYRTVALSGEDTIIDREKAVERLVSDYDEDALDYIFTVDIFNEGIDIPEVNQIVMLRPTQSPVIFIQQLGRGLRKSKDKEFVVIIDFIGNYNNNYMIPMALFGDKTYNKDNVRRIVREGTKILPGASTINFDEIAKKKIYESIDIANFNDSKIIKDAYQELKFKLGRIPNLNEFEEYGSMDVQRIFDSKTYGSYYNFLVSYEKEYNYKLDDIQKQMLEFVSKKLGAGKRIHELLVLTYILNGEDNLISKLEKELKELYRIKFNENTKVNVVNVLTNNFNEGTGANTYSKSIFIEKSDTDYRASKIFLNALEDSEFKRLLSETIEVGLNKNKKKFGSRYKDTSFNLYEKYTYEEVGRLLEWSKSNVAQNIGGYIYHEKTKSFPVFINYDKTDEIADTIKYEDRFISPNKIISLSKSGRKISSKDVRIISQSKELGVDINLFVRKNKDDKISKEFYYLGRILPTGELKELKMENTNKTVVEIEYNLDTPVREDIYDYIIS